MVFFPVLVGFDNKALVPWCAMEMGGLTVASLILDGEMPKSTVIHSIFLRLREGLKILHEAGGLIRVSVSCYLVWNLMYHTRKTYPTQEIKIAILGDSLLIVFPRHYPLGPQIGQYFVERWKGPAPDLWLWDVRDEGCWGAQVWHVLYLFVPASGAVAQAHSSKGSHDSSGLLELRVCGVSIGHLFHGRIDGAATERQNRAGYHPSLVQSLSLHHHMLVFSPWGGFVFF